jgi:hypothetical protein
MLSLLLMIRINHEHRKAMMKDKVPLLEDYLDRVHLLLWPRLKVGTRVLAWPGASSGAARGMASHTVLCIKLYSY